MLNFKKFSVYTLTVLFGLLITLSFLGCNSQKGNACSYYSSENELDQLNSDYWDKFNDMFMANHYDTAMLDVLSQWEKEAPLGDCYKCYFIYYFAQGVTQEDNSLYNIPDDKPYVKDGDIYRYEKLTVDKKVLDKGIDYLTKGIKKFGNRFDLWDQLLQICNSFCYHEELTNTLIWFMNTIEDSRKNDIQWFVRKNYPINTMENYTDNETLFYNCIRYYANGIVENYPEQNAFKNYEKIYRKFVELYPNDSSAYNELGYSIEDDTEESAQCYEKAYELDHNNEIAILNVALKSHELNDTEKEEKFRKILYDTGNEYLIRVYEENTNN